MSASASRRRGARSGAAQRGSAPRSRTEAVPAPARSRGEAVQAAPLRRTEAVQAAQRARIVHATALAAREIGIAQVSVAEIVARAGISRRTFYELYENGAACMLATFRHAQRLALEAIAAEQASAGDSWREQIAAGLLGLLRFLDEQPVLGGFLIIDSAGAGHEVLTRRAEAVRRAAEAVRMGESCARSSKGLTRMSAEGVAGAVLCVLCNRMLAGDEGRLTRLHGELMAMIVRPYLGPAAAAAELARPAPAPPRSRRARGRLAQAAGLRLTARTMMVLRAIATQPGASNRQVGEAAGISDQGQISKLLARLHGLGLVENDSAGVRTGMPNAWSLTETGAEVQGLLSGGA